MGEFTYLLKRFFCAITLIPTAPQNILHIRLLLRRHVRLYVVFHPRDQGHLTRENGRPLWRHGSSGEEVGCGRDRDG